MLNPFQPESVTWGEHLTLEGCPSEAAEPNDLATQKGTVDGDQYTCWYILGSCD